MKHIELRREYMDDAAELRAFAEKVAQLRTEGLAIQTVSQRLGVPAATLYDRLRKAPPLRRTESEAP
jgi:hypothetical protein